MRWLLPFCVGFSLMPEPSVPPPLRVRNPAGTFNQIPVFELEVSGGTLQKVSPIRTRLLIDSGAGGTGAPTDAPYVTYSANATLSAERILTAGSSVTIVTDGSAIYINALTGGGGTTVYAATGNQYVTISAAADLTDEYIIRASTGLSLTSASNVLLVHYGSLLVTTSRSISTLFPLTGGGDLSADRTVSADTAFLVTSARTITAGVGLTGGGNLGADRTIDLNTGSTGQYMVTSAGAAEGIAWINTAAAGGIVYAATGNQYVTISGAADLTDEYILGASTGLSITSANNIVLLHYGSLLVTTSRTISTTLPLSGGGTLAADRTFTIVTANNDTAGAIAAADFKLFNLGRVSTDRTITTLYPLTGGGLNLSADRTFSVDTAFLVTSARTITAGVGLTGGGNLGADRTIDLLTGGAGQYVITSIGAAEGIAWINTAAAGGGPVYAPTGGEYVTYTANADLTAERVLTAGTYIAITSDVAGTVFVAQSQKTVKVSLALLTVQPNSANAFWVAQTGTNVDFGHVRFVDGGEGIATWCGIVPFNVAPTPKWNVDIYSVGGSITAAGTAVFTTQAKSIAHGEDLDSAAYTLISSALNTLIFRSNTLTISAVSGGNFDSVVAISAGDYLLVELTRHGGNANDGLADFWDVKAVTAQMDIV